MWPCSNTYISILRPRVPAMVTDLMDSSLAGYPLETLFFGGAPAPQALIERARSVFPGAQLYVTIGSCLTRCSLYRRSQGYGLTETNSISVAVSRVSSLAYKHST